MKKNMLAVGILITLGILSCTDEITSINENIEVKKITDVIDAVIDSNLVLLDSTVLDDEIIKIEEEIIIKE
jgi:hypothetical protein